MGRLLVMVGLATVLLLLAAALLLAWLVLAALSVWVFQLATTGGPLLPRVPGTPPRILMFLAAAAIYLLLLVPLASILALIQALRASRSITHRSYPTPWDMRGKRIAAVLTALNDEEAIAASVDEVRKLPEVGSVIVVENSSTDGTAAVARAHGARVVTETQRGYGHACIRGLQEALRTTDAEVIVLLEGDGTFFAEDLRKLVPFLADCDMALGTRTNRELNRPGSQMDWFMAWGNLFLAFLIRLRYWDPTFLGAVQLTDVGCTFRAIRRDALERIHSQLTVGGMYFSPHMILIALRNRLSVVEAPIKFRERIGVSKGAGRGRWRALAIGLEMLREVTLH